VKLYSNVNLMTLILHRHLHHVVGISRYK